MAQSLKEKRKIFLNKKSFPQPILKVQILIRGKRVWFFSFGVLSGFPSGRWMEEPTTTSVRFKMGDQVRGYHLQEGLGFGTLRNVQEERGLKSAH